jgi:hypothetical protein
MGVCSVSLPLDVAVGSVDDMVVFIIMQDVWHRQMRKINHCALLHTSYSI